MNFHQFSKYNFFLTIISLVLFNYLFYLYLVLLFICGFIVLINIENCFVFLIQVPVLEKYNFLLVRNCLNEVHDRNTLLLSIDLSLSLLP